MARPTSRARIRAASQTVGLLMSKVFVMRGMDGKYLV